MKILANSTFVYEHLAIVDHRWYIFPSLRQGEKESEKESESDSDVEFDEDYINDIVDNIDDESFAM